MIELYINILIVIVFELVDIYLDNSLDSEFA